MIRTKRAYESPDPDDGRRYLVDRYWPRGVSREELELDDWLKELAPSDDLRTWFDHDPDRWEEFRRRYARELESKTDLLRGLLDEAEHHTVTLIYAAQDKDHNNARALKEYLEQRRQRG